LPSNAIVDIALNSVTGETFFVTDKGMVSFTSDATVAAQTFSNIKIYPNPVRPQASVVTVMGLVQDAEITITDMTGHWVHSGTANGGTFTWDLQRQDGARVETGVYVVLMISTDASQHEVGKILVVK